MLRVVVDIDRVGLTYLNAVKEEKLKERGEVRHQRKGYCVERMLMGVADVDRVGPN